MEVSTDVAQRSRVKHIDPHARAKFQLSIIFVFVCMLALHAVSSIGTNQLIEVQRMVVVTQDSVEKLHGIRSDLIDCEAKARGYILTGREDFLGLYRIKRQRVLESIRDIQDALLLGSSFASRVDQTAGDVRRRLTLLDEVVETRRQGRSLEEMGRLVSASPGLALMSRIWQEWGEIITAEEALLERRMARAESIAHTLFTASLVSAIVLTLALLASLHAFRRYWLARDEMERALRTSESGLTQALCTIEQRSADLQEKNEELARLSRELSRSNEELQSFAYAASHDLQEPLRVIVGYGDLLKRRHASKLEGEASEFLDFMIDGASRMQSLVKDLLSFARLGSQGAAMELVDSGAVARETLQSLRPVIDAAGARIAVDALPAVRANRQLLGQLFQNLITNAIKFRSERAPEIRLAAERQEGGYVFSITDNGIGIEPGFFQSIFELFTRVHGRGEYQGNGIGLATCKKIVERHGGRIWVESQAGKGTTFRFTMPDAGEEVRGDHAAA